MTAIGTNWTRAARRGIAGVLVALLAAAVMAPAASADWSPPEDIRPAGYDLTSVIVRYDGTGRAYAFFSRYVPYNNSLYLRERAPGSATWGPPQTIPSISPSPGSLDAAVSPDGDIVVGYTNGQAIAVRRPAGGAWEPAVQYSSPGTAGPYSGYAYRVTVDIGLDGTTMMAWSPWNSSNGNVYPWRALAAAYQPGVGWDATPQVWDTSVQDVHNQPTAAVDDTGHGIVIWGSRDASTNDVIYSAEWSAGSWTAPVLRSTIGSSCCNYIDADSAGSTIAFIWSRGSGMHAIVNTGGTWSPSYYLSGNQLGGTPSIAVGAEDTVFATWNNQNPVSTVLARRLPGQGFTQEPVAAATAGAYAYQPVIAANSNNDIALAWSEYVTAASTRYAFAAFAPANGPLGAPTQVTNTASDNTPLLSVAVDPWGHGLAAATPILQGLGKGLFTTVEMGVPVDIDGGTTASIAPSVAEAGDSLTCTPSGFLGTPPFAHSYEWLRDGVTIAGADQASYVATSQDIGAGISCTVTATNEGGTASVTSAEVIIDATPPANLSLPAISGPTAVGELVTCLPGTWSGDPTPELTFDWLVNGISTGETADSYEITLAEAGSTIACLVTATNDGGTADAASVTQNIPTVSTPLNTKVPKITGLAIPSIGTTLSCSSGTWTGQPAPSLYTDWLRDGQLIPGATQAAYVVTADDAGTVLSCQVEGENVAGSQTVASSNSRTLDPAPANTALPRMVAQSGSTWSVGGVGRCQRGSWTNAQTYSFQWLLGGAPLVGETSEFLPITAAYSGSQLSCTVTATGRMGSAQATSLGRAVPTAPTNTVPPTITGTARPGRTLTCNRGTWLDVQSYAYSWQRNGVTATSTTNKYTVAAGDVGATITCGVTATGPGGSTTAYAAGRVITP